jgi:hypothetical protein
VDARATTNTGSRFVVEIKLDERAHELVAAAILSTITGEARDSILSAAVASLIEPKKDSYGRDKITPIQEAFNRSVERVSERVVEEFVKGNEEFKTNVAAKVATYGYGPDWECSGCGAIGAGAIAKHVSCDGREVNVCHHCVCEIEIAAVDALRARKQHAKDTAATDKVLAEEVEYRRAIDAGRKDAK